jgi:hypothetical protein
MAKYPTPQSMSEQLSALAKATQNTPKLSAKYEQLASACSTLNAKQYPAFLKKIVGFSKLWSTTAKVAGGAVAVAGAAYLTKLAVNAYNDADTFKTDDPNKVLSKTDKAKMFGQSMWKHAKGDYDKATKMINDWRNKNSSTAPQTTPAVETPKPSRKSGLTTIVR